MAKLLLTNEKLNELLPIWAEDLDIQAPLARREGVYDFGPWDREKPIQWDYDLAYNSLKRFLLPAEEDILHFDLKLDRAEPVFDPFPRLLLGVHPYDSAAIAQLDRLMLSGSVDVHYKARRDALVVFGLTPYRAHKAVFWPSVGVGDGLMDALWTRIDRETWLVETGSERGLELMNMAGELPQAGPAEMEAAEVEKARARQEASRNGLKFPWQDIPELLTAMEGSRLWSEKSSLCLSCGSCVMVCPTCWCFSMRDEVTIGLLTAKRFRVWDGCMLPGFAEVAGGGNFRKTPESRYRHRFKRKGSIIYNRIGELGCTGCGRCSLACTAGIADPAALFNALWEARS